MIATRSSIAGVILAGGLARRLGGGDKCLLPIDGRPLLAHIIARLEPQVDAIAVNANGDSSRFAAFGRPVLADPIQGHLGPLAGILAGLDWAAGLPGRSHLATVSGDTPFIPADMVRHLAEAAYGVATISVASSNGRTHPTAALWPVALRAALEKFLRDGGSLRVRDFMNQHPVVTIEFPGIRLADGEADPFFNINTPADLVEAGRLSLAMR